MKIYAFLIPMLITIFLLTIKPEKIVEEKEVVEDKEKVSVILYKEDEILTLELEEYVKGVVACEMPASFELEALKAMAVASRTYALSKRVNNIIETNPSDQCYIGKTEMKEKWNDKYEYYYNIIETSVNETKNKYISYNDSTIKAFYFSTSNGYTENVESVFSENLEYLESVYSPWDINTKNYLQTIKIDVVDFNSKFNVNNLEVINIISRNDTNRVEKVIVNNIEYSGVEFRKILGLRSTDFDIEYNNETVTITTRGYGHGVGMSQYGANGMAKEGYTYEEILKYYYKNINILSV
ncbi:MAG: stage II sporulation protein D [Bacilli bacterium]|nr:stage II sporulation protein D [Bacilli bacterium]